MKKVFFAIAIAVVSYGAYATHQTGDTAVKSRVSKIDAAVEAAVAGR